MAFDFQLHMPKDSRQGQAIQSLVDERSLTPEQALECLLDAGVEQTPINAILAGRGLFSEPEDAKALDAAVALAYEERREPSSPCSIGLAMGI